MFAKVGGRLRQAVTEADMVDEKRLWEIEKPNS